MPNTVSENTDYPTIAESESWLARARGLVPALTQTLAKGPGQYVRGVAPVYASRAKGSHLWDVDGNEYLDWQMAIGPIVLGYGHDAVDDAIRRQLADGITFSLVHPLEVEVAERIRDVVPERRDGALQQDRLRRDDRGRPPRARVHGSEQGALLRVSRLARLVHRHDRSPRGHPRDDARPHVDVPVQRPRQRPRRRSTTTSLASSSSRSSSKSRATGSCTS